MSQLLSLERISTSQLPLLQQQLQLKAAASRRKAKYADLPASFSVQPIAMETLQGPINDLAIDFL